MFRRTGTFGVVSLTALLLAGCSTAGSPVDPASAGDVTLVSIQPASGMVGTDPAGPVVLRFSRSMSTGMEALVVLHEGSVEGPVVAVAAMWSGDRLTLTLIPSFALRPRTQYVVHLSPTLMDTDGHMIDLSSGMMMGGTRVAGGTPGAGSMMTSRSGAGMMGGGWSTGVRMFGMAFSFTTG